MALRIVLLWLLATQITPRSLAATWVAVTDHTNYNVGSVVQIRLDPAAPGLASIRYAGETTALVSGIPVREAEYALLWTIPANAKTGRYEVDIAASDGSASHATTSFAVHRQLAKVTTLELDKTFYVSGDPVNPFVVVRNLSSQPLDHLLVEFEAYTFPWIAQPSDEPPMWKTVVAGSLALAPGEERSFHVHKAAVVQAGKEPVVIYFSVVIRDSRDPSRIYDLAFAPPAFTSPPNVSEPKAYPFLYLYTHLTDVPKSEAYRNFYPPEFVSDAIRFDTAHTLFGTENVLSFSFEVAVPAGKADSLSARVLASDGRELRRQEIPGSVPGRHELRLEPLPAGLYTLEVSERANNVSVARNRLEFAVNRLPKSVLIFAGHQDDDTAHPGIVRLATENHIPIHVVYFTGSDGGGCDRFYMHSCDAERAMDFSEVRMNEARASLGHLGVPRENIFFLGLPDGGSEQIWYDYPHATQPYHSVLLASEYAPYREAAIPNLPFSRDSAIQAAKDYIARFQPDLIVTGHPDERHVDHRVNNWFVVKAMQDLLHEGRLARSTRLVVDVVYGAQPGRHAPYRYAKYQLYVSGEAAKIGQEALWYYQSQDGNHQQANIVDYAHLPREEAYPHFEILDWAEHEGWNERR